jgi:hypothetical protein
MQFCAAPSRIALSSASRFARFRCAVCVCVCVCVCVSRLHVSAYYYVCVLMLLLYRAFALSSASRFGRLTGVVTLCHAPAEQVLSVPHVSTISMLLCTCAHTDIRIRQARSCGKVFFLCVWQARWCGKVTLPADLRAGAHRRTRT